MQLSTALTERTVAHGYHWVLNLMSKTDKSDETQRQSTTEFDYSLDINLDRIQSHSSWEAAARNIRSWYRKVRILTKLKKKNTKNHQPKNKELVTETFKKL